MAESLQAMNTLAEKILDRFESMDLQLAELQAQLRVSDARLDDLNLRDADRVIDLPNPLSSRLTQ